MLEKHPDEVAAFYGEKFLFPVVSLIFVSESDMRICDFCDPAVGDCSSEGIPRKVTDCVSLAVKGLFDEGQPPFLKQAINKFLKTGGICQFPGHGKDQVCLPHTTSLMRRDIFRGTWMRRPPPAGRNL